MTGKQDEKYTILYARLSDEDARQGKSVSIENQEKLLRAKAEELGLSNPIFLFDDGISGTKEKRPGFQEAIQLIREQKVSTFMVTDLSRLFRHQSKANDMLEVTFPAMGVRFVSINDGYDSDTNTPSEQDLAMFLNLFNEMYPRMTSRKINAINKMKAEAGERLGSTAPYGYRKDPENKKKIIPDSEAAQVVLHIFELCASGLGPTQIANQLKKEKVLVPTEYAYQKFHRNHRMRDPERPFEWSNTTIATILEDPVYIGTQVSFQTHKVSYKDDKVIPVPVEEQYRTKDAHEAIIPLELWDVVQNIRSHKRRPTTLGTMDILSGKVICADCGRSENLCRCGNWEESKHVYVCGSYHNRKECSPHTIKAVHLRNLVLLAIRSVCAEAKLDRKALAERLMAKQNKQAQQELSRVRKELDEGKHRLAELDTLLSIAFEKLAAGTLTDEQFKRLTTNYEAEKEALLLKIPILESSLQAKQEKVENTDKFLALVDRYMDFAELTPEIVNELIDHIEVHERSEPYKKKHYTQDVDIYFNHIGKLSS